MDAPIFVIGRTQSGKSTVAGILAELTGLKVGETGDVIMRHIGRKWDVCYDCKILRELKPHLRQYLFDTGAELCKADPAALVRACIEGGAGIVCGIRRQEEMDAALKAYPGATVVWVTRPGAYRGPTDGVRCVRVEPWIVHNDGTIAELRETVARFCVAKGFIK